MKFAAVILAGGEGRRIGGKKPLALLGGQTLLDRALALARTWSDDVAVSLRTCGQFPLPGDVAALVDEEGAGPLAGLQAALRFAHHKDLEGVLTLPCDTPFVPGDLPHRLADKLAGDVDAVLATSGGNLHPACALWRCNAINALPSYRATGGSSLRGFAAYVGFATADWPCEPFDPFFNVNSPGDLAAAETLLKTR